LLVQRKGLKRRPFLCTPSRLETQELCRTGQGILITIGGAKCKYRGGAKSGCQTHLGSEATHEDLRRLFEAYGEVAQVHIIVDRDTGLPRGFAFVEMTNDTEAEKAIRALNGSILRDRTLDVNYARPGPERLAA